MSNISVIVPIYNAEKFLDKCIRSILNQTYNKFELILVNDGSTDSSLEICNKYKKRDKRVRIINKKNEGVIEARKKGIREAKFDYVTFVDADDWIHKKCLEIAWNEINKTNSDIVVFNMFKVVGKLGLIKRKNNSIYFSNSEVYQGERIKKELVNAYLHGHPFPANLCGKLYKKEYLNNSGKYLSKIKFLGEDLFYNMEVLLMVKKVSVINNVLYYYRAGGGTSKYMPYLFEDAVNGYNIQKEVIDNYFNDIGENRYNGPSVMLLNTIKTCLSNIFYSKNGREEKENIIYSYLNNNEVREAANNKGAINFFEKDFLLAIKRKDVKYMYDIGEREFKKIKIRKIVLNVLSNI